MSSEPQTLVKNSNPNIIPQNGSLIPVPPNCNDNSAGTSCVITPSITVRGLDLVSAQTKANDEMCMKKMPSVKKLSMTKNDDIKMHVEKSTNGIQNVSLLDHSSSSNTSSSDNNSTSANTNNNTNTSNTRVVADEYIKNVDQMHSRNTECSCAFHSEVINKSKLSPSAIEALPRIRRELRDIMCNPPPNCSSHVVSDDIFHWSATIAGPVGSVYEGGNFILDIRLPSLYPFRPPRIRFSTRIYHCNIDSRGVICLDVLNEKWSPVLTISKVLLSVWLLLCECNSDDPLVIAIAEQYQTRRAEHDKIAREWVRKYAMTAAELEKTAKQIEQSEAPTTYVAPPSTEAAASAE